MLSSGPRWLQGGQRWPFHPLMEAAATLLSRGRPADACPVHTGPAGSSRRYGDGVATASARTTDTEGQTMAAQEQKTVAFVLYPGLTLLDLVGPLQVFASLRRFNDQYRPVVVAERIEPMPTDGPLTVTADQTFAARARPDGGDRPWRGRTDHQGHGQPDDPRVSAPRRPDGAGGRVGLHRRAGPGRRRPAGGPPGHHPLGLPPPAGTPGRHLCAAAVGGGRQVHHLGRGVGRDRHGPGAGRPADR